MPFRRVFPFLFAILVGAVLSPAENTPPPRITKETREQIVHAFASELVYIRTNFPMGKTGLKLKDGVLTPSGDLESKSKTGRSNCFSSGPVRSGTYLSK